MTGGKLLKKSARIEKLWQIFIAFVVVFNRAAAFGDKLRLKSFIVNIKHSYCASALCEHFFQDTPGVSKIIKVSKDAVCKDGVKFFICRQILRARAD